MVVTIVFVIFIVHICLCVTRPVYGTMSYICIRQIIPPIARVGSLSLNTACLVVLLFWEGVNVFLLHKARNKRVYYLPILFLTLPLALLGVLAVTPYEIQIKHLIQFSMTELCPFTALCLAINNRGDINKIVWTLFLSFLVIGVYGICTYFIRINPLVILFAHSFSFEGDLYVGSGIEGEAMRGVLDGGATGNMTGPLSWGQYTLLVLLFSLFPMNDSQRTLDKMRMPVILVSFVNCILSIKRSVIAPAVIALSWLIMQYATKQKKKFVLIIVSSFVGIFCLFNIPTFSSVVENNVLPSVLFWNDDFAQEHDVEGSSKEMRMEQFAYLHDELLDSFVWGNGYGYNIEYTQKYDVSTPMKAFESIFFQVIANSGYVGLLIWLLFFFKCYRLTLSETEKKVTNISFHLLYFLSLTLTGIQTSFWFFMIIVAILYKKRVITSSMQ